MVDLEQNWYSYLCPMLNWFIPIKFTELTYQEFNNINIFHNGGQKSHGMMASWRWRHYQCAIKKSCGLYRY